MRPSVEAAAGGRDISGGISRRSQLGLVASVVATVVISVVLRQTGVPKLDTIWAEDGMLFADCLYGSTALACLATPYAGYLHLVPRLGAMIAVALGPMTLAPALALVAAAIGALGAATIALVMARVTRRPLAGLLAGASVALVYPAALESVGDLGNLHTILFVAVLVVLVGTWFGRPPTPADYLLFVITALSTPFIPFLAPALLIGLLLRAPHVRRAAIVLAVAFLPQVVTVLTSPKIPPEYPLPSAVHMVGWFWTHLGHAGWFGVSPFNTIVPGVALSLLFVRLRWPGLAATETEARAFRRRSLLFLVGLAACLAAGSFLLVFVGRDAIERSPLTVVALAIGVVGLAAMATGLLAGVRLTARPDLRPWLPEIASLTLIGTSLSIFLVASVIRHTAAPRYAFFVSVLTVAAIAIEAASLASLSPRTLPRPLDRLAKAAHAQGGIPLVAVALLFAVGYGLTFRVETPASSGPSVSAQLTQARAACRAGRDPGIVVISPLVGDPPRWLMAVTCDRFTPGVIR